MNKDIIEESKERIIIIPSEYKNEIDFFTPSIPYDTWEKSCMGKNYKTFE